MVVDSLTCNIAGDLKAHCLIFPPKVFFFSYFFLPMTHFKYYILHSAVYEFASNPAFAHFPATVMPGLDL